MRDSTATNAASYTAQWDIIDEIDSGNGRCVRASRFVDDEIAFYDESF